LDNKPDLRRFFQLSVDENHNSKAPEKGKKQVAIFSLMMQIISDTHNTHCQLLFFWLKLDPHQKI